MEKRIQELTDKVNRQFEIIQDQKIQIRKLKTEIEGRGLELTANRWYMVIMTIVIILMVIGFLSL